MHKTPMTKYGHDLLHKELEHLKKIERPRIIAAIAEARGHGDLKENAEYHAAKESQSFIEGRISDIEAKLSHSHVIDVSEISNDGKVIFGATVTIVNSDTDEKVTYQIVGEDEADLKHNKVSISSPIARALIGKFVDDEVIVRTPQGEISYQIDQVQYI